MAEPMTNNPIVTPPADYKALLIDALQIDLRAAETRVESLAADNAVLVEMLHAGLDELHRALARYSALEARYHALLDELREYRARDREAA
jgi:hypothetical protein